MQSAYRGYLHQKKLVIALLGAGVIFIALRYCDRFVLLHGGCVYAAGGSEVMTAEAIQTVYGVDVEIIFAHGVPVVLPVPEVGASRSESV